MIKTFQSAKDWNKLERKRDMKMNQFRDWRKVTKLKTKRL